MTNFVDIIKIIVPIFVDEFNRKVLMPELTPSQLEELHVELRDLYRVYCDPASVDRIQFDDSIVTQLKQSKRCHDVMF